MADLKISALPASTTPLAGTEVLPVVQSSTTKNVSVANLTAGRAVSALSYASTTGATFATTSGNVGIGATAPAAALSFSKGDGETNGIVIGHPNWANTYYAGIYGTVTNGASNTQGFFKVGTRVNATDAALTDAFWIGSNGGTSISSSWIDPGANGLAVAGNIIMGTAGKGTVFGNGAGVSFKGTLSGASVSTTPVTCSESATSGGGVVYVSGYNASGGNRFVALIGFRDTIVTPIYLDNNTGLVLSFTASSNVLRLATVSGTVICSSVSLTV